MTEREQPIREEPAEEHEAEPASADEQSSPEPERPPRPWELEQMEEAVDDPPQAEGDRREP